jgi:AraC-like DNA-binding protein
MRAMSAHRNTTATVRAVLAVCKKAKVDTEALLAEAGISPEAAYDVDGEVTLDQMRGFWQAAYRLSGNPHLALHAGQEVTPGAYKSLDYLLVTAPTLGTGLSRFVKYLRLINTWINFDFEETEEGVGLVLRSLIGPVPPPAVEYTFAALTSRMRRALGAHWTPANVSFTHAPRPDHFAYAAYFGCPVEFAADRCELLFGRDDWEAPIPCADAALFRLVDAHSLLLLDSRSAADDIAAKVRSKIAKTLKDGEPHRDTVARRLGVSGRTLHRRLGEAGVTFSELVEEVRKDLASSYLARQDLALSEVSFILGFSDQSAFTRAFKRWTGLTPHLFRKRLPSRMSATR